MMMVITKDVTNFVQNAGVTMGVEMGVRVPVENTETLDQDPVEAVVEEVMGAADLEEVTVTTMEEEGVATDVKDIPHPEVVIQICLHQINE